MIRFWKRAALVVLLVAVMLVCVGAAIALAEDSPQANSDPLNTAVVNSDSSASMPVDEQNGLVNNQPEQASSTSAIQPSTSANEDTLPDSANSQDSQVETVESESVSSTSISQDSQESNLQSQTSSPQVSTDKSDYVPGQTVYITGEGFASEESVESVINDAQETEVFRGITSTDSTGLFQTSYTLPLEGSSTLYNVRATGLSSGLHASTSFTDPAATVEFVASPYILDPSGGGNIGDKDGEPPVSSNADPSVAIVLVM